MVYYPVQKSHPDMLLFFGKEAVYTTRSYYAIAKEPLGRICEHLNRALCLIEKEVCGGYPNEVLFNAAPVGKLLFCLPEFTAREILQNEGYRICPVRQGYAKCSLLPLGDGAIITADPSVATAARAEGLDVLLLDVQGVLLDGYDTGFFGGCTSFAPYSDEKTIYFCGALSLHPEHARIQDFCRKHGKNPVSLGEAPLRDMGTIFLI